MRLLSLSLVLLFISCSGYKIAKNDNNFKKYGVKSISIPMFYNQSILPNVSSVFTKSFTKELNSIRNLNIKSPNSMTVDSYFVGIVRSEKYEKNVIRRNLSNRIKDITPLNAPNNENLVSIGNSLKLTVEVFLIRRSPDSKSLIAKLREQEFPELIRQHPSIILRRSIPISYNFIREIYDSSDSVVNATQYYGTLEKVLDKVSVKAASDFRDSIDYVF